MKTLTLTGFLLLSCAMLTVNVYAQEDASSKTAKTSISGTIAAGTMYHGFDVGGNFFGGPVQKNSLTITHQLTNKLSVSIDFWGQYSLTKTHPNTAEELDVSGSLTYEPQKGTALEFSAGNFKVDGLSIQKFSITANHIVGKIGKVPINLSNNFNWFTTSTSTVKGGVVNKSGFSGSISISDKTRLSMGVWLGIDNGPFELKGPAAMFFVEGKVERKLNKHWSVFSVVRFSRPIVGETIRKPIVSGDTGLAFRFDM